MTGYKRLTYVLQNEFEAGVRAHQVHAVLQEERLLGMRAVFPPFSLKKPEAPNSPNQVWHIDLMYLRVQGRWYYLADILDAFSRYIVHWTLNATMQTHTVTLTVQEALDKWKPAKPPAIVHDSGCQFLSKDWRDFAEHHGMPSIRTRVAHPESNGLIERLHRTHRAEALADTESWTLEKAMQEMAKWVATYNNRRPHFALHGLPPVVYYLGEPDAAMAQRENFVLNAAESRTTYWQQNPQTIIQPNLAGVSD
jgi:transposase InsO family protein